jgi:glycosyltransferase involved in cell wall biosynthesis
MGASKPHVVYISYDGMSEPLGVSQVLGYLTRLARDHRITLVSFEKSTGEMDPLRRGLAATGIDWRPLRYHRNPAVISTALDVLRGRRELRRIDAPDLVHVRSDVPALIALRSAAPMLFDIRGFWADERVDGGLWKRDGLLHRIARYYEARFYARAAAVVTLTEASVGEIRRRTTCPVDVIPTCVDHHAFARNSPRPGGPHAIWSGSVGTWYRFDLAPRLAAALDMPLTVLTRQVDEAQTALAGSAGEVRSVEPVNMPHELCVGDVGLCLIVSTSSKRASAPTRFAEFLAAGMPVIVTPGVGDLEALVTAHRVGVVLRGEDQTHLQRAADQVRALAADPGTPARCRQLASSRFDLDWGARRYAALYRDLART